MSRVDQRRPSLDDPVIGGAAEARLHDGGDLQPLASPQGAIQKFEATLKPKGRTDNGGYICGASESGETEEFQNHHGTTSAELT